MLTQLRDKLWDVLPVFFNSPTDAERNFKSCARALGDVLKATEEQKELLEDRRNVPATHAQIQTCQALSMLIDTLQARGPSVNPFLPVQQRLNAMSSELKAVAVFSKNFLPLLFNLARTVDTDQQRELILDTIGAFARVSPVPLLNQWFQKVLQKFLEMSSVGGEEEKVACRLADALCALCHGSPAASNCALAAQAVYPCLGQSRQIQLQKKGYKIIIALVKLGNVLHEPNPSVGYEVLLGELVRTREAVTAQRYTLSVTVSHICGHGNNTRMRPSISLRPWRLSK